MKMIDRVKHPFRGTKEDAIIGVIEYSTFEQSDTRECQIKRMRRWFVVVGGSLRLIRE